MRVLIDPGHGGSDPGCSSMHTGALEKTVALDIALGVDEILRRGKWPDVVETLMTRKIDKRVGLSDRCAEANDFDADLAVSIHLNADDGIDEGAAEPSGFEVWCYRQRPLGVLPLTKGYRVAQLVEAEFAGFSALRNRGIKTVRNPKDDSLTKARARYFLENTAMTAVLVECGFLTSPVDSVWYADPPNRERAARAIANAVLGARSFL